MAITQTNRDKAKGRRFLGCFFLLFLLFSLAMSAVFVWPLVQIYRARDWRETPCTILTSKVGHHRSGKGGPTYSVDVTYEYLVDDQRHVGTRYKFMGGSSSGYDGKKAIVDRLKPGTVARCYVNKRDPDDSVIERSFTADILFGGIPLLFALIGAGGLYGVFFRKSRPPLPGAAPGIPTAKGAKASGALKTSSTPAVRFGFSLVFALIWNGVVLGMGMQCLTGWRSGHGDGCLTVFLMPFAAVGLAVGVFVLYNFLSLFNPRPSLTLRPPTVALGDPVEIEWTTSGNVDRVRSFTITLEGREEATRQSGKSSTTDKVTFAKIDVVHSTRGKDLRRGEAKLLIPADSMHSFRSAHNKFVWVLHVKADIPHWPDIGEDYPLDVLPQRMGPGGSG